MAICQLFVTCLVDGFKPSVGVAVVRILEAAGWHVAFPLDQTCCGQPAFNAGSSDRAGAMARHTIDTLDATHGPIVVPSGSCGDMLVHHTPRLLSGTEHEEAARRVGERVVELTRFLLDEGIATQADDRTRVAVHRSCHGLRGLGLAGTAEEVLDRAGVDRCELEGADECCGFGGLFSIELPEVSEAMLDTKIRAIEASGADVVTGGDVSCLMHIEGGLSRRGSRVRAVHIAELLGGDA